MNTKCTLVSLFDKDKETLGKKLEGFVLPKDGELIQKTISEFLNKLLENDSDFRQSLTQSEDYVLQAALSLLSAQQNILNTIATTNPLQQTPLPEKTSFKNSP